MTDAPICRAFHDSCLEMFKLKLIKGFIYTLKVYFVAHAVPLIMYKRRELFSNPIEALKKFLKRVGWSMCFFSGFIYLVRICSCICNRLIPFGKGYVLLVSALSSTPIVFEYTNRMIEYNMFTIPRVFEGFWDLCYKLGKIRSLDSYSTALFSIFMGLAFSLNKYFPEYVEQKYRPLFYWFLGLPLQKEEDEKKKIDVLFKSDFCKSSSDKCLKEESEGDLTEGNECRSK